MDPLSIVFGVIALVLLGVSVWLMLDRAKARENLARSDEVLSAAKSALASREVELKELVSRQQQSEGAKVDLERQLATEKAERRNEVQRIQDLSAKDLESAQREREQLKADIEKMNEQLTQRFRALAGEVLDNSRKALAEHHDVQSKLAGTELVKREKAFLDLLKKNEDRIKTFDEARIKGESQIAQQLEHQIAATLQLGDKTERFTKAMYRPEVRGKYGEVQLRTMLEKAGLKSYCDFKEQFTVQGERTTARPDVVVSLPNERVIVIDAKANYDGYMNAANADDPEEQEQHLKQFDRNFSDQIKSLSKKSYENLVKGSIDYVVMFVPGDQVLDTALRRQPDLIDRAQDMHVVLASPASLICLLNAVALGWREKQLAENMHELQELGKDLYERVTIAMKHLVDCGKSLDSAVFSYNAFVGSAKSRMVPMMRRFEQQQLVKGKDKFKMPKEIEDEARELLLPEIDSSEDPIADDLDDGN
ncbi:MAG: DNA recombination protein RmuC [Phycisphaeraceae bacterium]|nr:DNA recombination protein RmuC [Phycisphaerales bacterium]MCB9860588.1 DNA recombination protein RmuC [Phycisphaeraceae bacterium]